MFQCALVSLSLDLVVRVSTLLKWPHRKENGVPMLFDLLWRAKSPWVICLQYFSAVLSGCHPVSSILFDVSGHRSPRDMVLKRPAKAATLRRVFVRAAWFSWLKGPRRIEIMPYLLAACADVRRPIEDRRDIARSIVVDTPLRKLDPYSPVV